MKITRRELNKLIENYIKEGGTGDLKGASSAANYNKDPDADDFELTDDMLDPDQSAHEEYVRAVDAYRHPNKPVGNFPHLFRDKTPHIPSDDELEHVRRYQSQELGGIMPSIDNREITIHSPEIDEDTEESPFGTQYSLEDTEVDDLDDSSEEDEDTDDDGFLSKIRKFISGK